MKIAITGSLASGKTSATKFLSKGKYPTFNADNAVKQLYSQTSIIKKVRNKFPIWKFEYCIYYFVYKFIFRNSINFWS